jgi:hypothetical protein
MPLWPEQRPSWELHFSLLSPWNARCLATAPSPRVSRNYVELALLLSIQALDLQQLPLAELLALEPFWTNIVQLLEDRGSPAHWEQADNCAKGGTGAEVTGRRGIGAATGPAGEWTIGNARGHWGMGGKVERFLIGRRVDVLAMRKAAFTILGALLLAGSAVRLAAAREHHMRTGRGHHQSGRTYNNAAPPALDSYGKPAANVTQTCEIKWCYAGWYGALRASSVRITHDAQ